MKEQTDMEITKNPYAKTLIPVAAALGAAVGTLAGKLGLDKPGVQARRVDGKFVPQTKHRLPRKQKLLLIAA